MASRDPTSGIRMRDAGLLDIPFVFSLLTDASLNDGTFSELVLTSGGYASLFVSLLAALRIVQRWRLRKGSLHDLMIVETQGEPVGFVHCLHKREADGARYVYIHECVVAQQHRNQGYGTQIIEWIMSREAGRNTTILALCNRYAKAMQHIFKRHHFRRKSIGRGLDQYVLAADPHPRTGQPDMPCAKMRAC